jgi:hypothetical protein
MYGWHFVPLVTQDLCLLCGLDILFLRPDPPGGVVESGDIDNRLKTLFDALRIPVPGEDHASRQPGPEQTPFFCLLDNDRLITKIAVESDQMLQPVEGRFDQSAVRLVITVRVRPFEFDLGNIQFG